MVHGLRGLRASHDYWSAAWAGGCNFSTPAATILQDPGLEYDLRKLRSAALRLETGSRLGS